jgi:hypothetical protein
VFSLHSENVKIAEIKLSEERNPGTDVGCALKVVTRVPNDFLSQLHPTLKWSLFDKPEVEDLAQDPGYMPVLRYPLLGALKWEGEIHGGTFTIHAPITKHEMEFTAEVADVKLEPMEGGTVLLSFKATFSPQSAQVGRIAALLGKEVEISVVPPKALDLKAA